MADVITGTPQLDATELALIASIIPCITTYRPAMPVINFTISSSGTSIFIAARTKTIKVEMMTESFFEIILLFV